MENLPQSLTKSRPIVQENLVVLTDTKPNSSFTSVLTLKLIEKNFIDKSIQS